MALVVNVLDLRAQYEKTGKSAFCRRHSTKRVYTHSMDIIDGILEELGIAESARLVYLSLLQHGETTARLLAERTGITRPSVYDQIKLLKKYDLVVERDIDGKTFFGAGDVRQVSHILGDHIERLEIGKNLFDKNLSELVAQTHTVQPKIRFFEGKEGVQQMLKDMLWYEDITVSMCWPFTHMLSVLGKDYLEEFSKRRVRDRIALRTIWAHGERDKKKNSFTGVDTLVERRYAKAGQAFRMSYSIYDDKVVFISSAKEAYGFVVQSKEFAELMFMQFELLWNNSKK